MRSMTKIRQRIKCDCFIFGDAVSHLYVKVVSTRLRLSWTESSCNLWHGRLCSGKKCCWDMQMEKLRKVIKFCVAEAIFPAGLAIDCSPNAVRKKTGGRWIYGHVSIERVYLHMRCRFTIILWDKLRFRHRVLRQWHLSRSLFSHPFH
jgi:hypothetical protein